MSSFLVAAVLFCNANYSNVKARQYCVYDLGECSAKFEREFEYGVQTNKQYKKVKKSFRAEAEAQCFLFYKAEE